jgi:glycosyltransferase involved in cell wall biosynthesis
LTLLTDRSAPSEYHSGNAIIHTLPKGIRWHFAARKIICRSADVDYYISPSSFIVTAILPASNKSIPVVHDLIAFHNEPHDKKAVIIERLFLKKALRRAKHICTISNATKDDLLKKFPFLRSTDISVVFAGALPAQNRPHESGHGEYILSVGTLSPRKNQLRLIRAYSLLPSSLREKYKLVIVGARGWQDSEILKAVQNTPNVEWRDYVPDNEYESLLDHCTFFAFPSLYEGFGLPVIDAMQRSIPVLTSNCGSLAEVAGSAALFVDPEDEKDISRGMEDILTNPSLSEDLSRKGSIQAEKFSWKRTVDLFLQSINSL